MNTVVCAKRQSTTNRQNYYRFMAKQTIAAQKLKKYVRLKHAPLLPHKKSCSLKRILLEVRRLPAKSFSQNQLIASLLTDKLSTSILARPAIGFISKGTFLFE